MMGQKRITHLFLCFLLLSCGNPAPKEQKPELEKTGGTKPLGLTDDEKNNQEKPGHKSAVSHKKHLAGYDFEFGYTEYNEDKYGFQNPGYLRVLSKGKLIFEDRFEGEGEVNIKSLGNHALSGKKWIFTLNYGTPACDYNSVSRYYAVANNQKIRFFKECYASCGGDGYACHIFDQIFPEDSLGVPNTILFPEGISYNEHDQEDEIDTTRVVFSANSFKIKKPAKNKK